jgi:hypothetical protein
MVWSCVQGIIHSSYYFVVVFDFARVEFSVGVKPGSVGVDSWTTMAEISSCIDMELLARREGDREQDTRSGVGRGKPASADRPRRWLHDAGGASGV